MELKLKIFFALHTDLKLVILYGSFASGQEKPESDLDIGILGHKVLALEELLELKKQLQQEFKREIDLVDLRTAHGALLSEILSRGQIIILRDHEAYAQLIKRMWYEHEDDGRFLQKTLTERLKIWQK